MNNRLSDFSPPPPSAENECQREQSLFGAESLESAVAPVRRCVVENPLAALAVAFLAGVTLAWWIKRR